MRFAELLAEQPRRRAVKITSAQEVLRNLCARSALRCAQADAENTPLAAEVEIPEAGGVKSLTPEQSRRRAVKITSAQKALQHIRAVNALRYAKAKSKLTDL